MRRSWVVILALSVAPSAAAQVPDRLRTAVAEYARQRGALDVPAFRHELVDLDGDERDDAVVLMWGREWCGTGGCELLVLRDAGDHFAIVSTSSVTREPVRLLSDASHGWRTLIVYAKGKGDVLMQFDGKHYPSNASLQPRAEPGQVAAARVLLK